MSDEFDFMSRRCMTALVETAYVIDAMEEGPFQAGGISALEEFYFRMTGAHFDWELFKLLDVARGAQKERANEICS